MTDTVDQLSEAEWDSLPPSEQENGAKAKPGPTTSATENAPYGYTASGRVRKRPLGSRSHKPGRKQKSGTDYRDGINGVSQIIATGLAIAGDKNPVLLADAVAVTQHAPNISESLNSLAHERPEVAAVLDKVLQVGPYGLVIGAMVPLFAQIMTNHKIAPPGMLGTVPAEDLIKQVPRVMDEAA